MPKEEAVRLALAEQQERLVKQARPGPLAHLGHLGHVENGDPLGQRGLLAVLVLQDDLAPEERSDQVERQVHQGPPEYKAH